MPDFVEKGRPAGGEEVAFAIDDVLFAVAEGIVSGEAPNVQVDVAAVARITGDDGVFGVPFLCYGQIIKIVMQGGLARSRFDETDIGVATDIRHRRTDIGFLCLAECPKAAQVEAADAVVGVGREVVTHGQRLSHDVSGEVPFAVVRVVQCLDEIVVVGRAVAGEAAIADAAVVTSGIITACGRRSRMIGLGVTIVAILFAAASARRQCRHPTGYGNAADNKRQRPRTAATAGRGGGCRSAMRQGRRVIRQRWRGVVIRRVVSDGGSAAVVGVVVLHHGAQFTVLIDPEILPLLHGFRRSCRLNVIAFIRLGKDGLHTAAVNINHADAVGGIFHNKVVHSASLGVVERGFMIIRLHYFHLLPLALWLFVIKRLHNWCFSF